MVFVSQAPLMVNIYHLIRPKERLEYQLGKTLHFNRGFGNSCSNVHINKGKPLAIFW